MKLDLSTGVSQDEAKSFTSQYIFGGENIHDNRYDLISFKSRVSQNVPRHQL